MLSCRKAATPAPMNSNRPNTTTARRLRQKAISSLNIAECPAFAALIARRCFEQVAQEHAAICDQKFARPQAREYLIASVCLQAQFYRALQEVMAIGGNPGDHGAVPLAYERCSGHGGRIDRATDPHNDVSQHARSQFVAWVRHLRASGHAMGVRVNRGVDPDNPSKRSEERRVLRPQSAQ